MNASTPERPALPVPVGDETEALRKLIASQAEDVAPWFFGRTSGEAHLQRELRKLHAAVERLLLARVAGLEAREASLRDALSPPVGDAVFQSRDERLMIVARTDGIRVVVGEGHSFKTSDLEPEQVAFLAHALNKWIARFTSNA